MPLTNSLAQLPPTEHLAYRLQFLKDPLNKTLPILPQSPWPLKVPPVLRQLIQDAIPPEYSRKEIRVRRMVTGTGLKNLIAEEMGFLIHQTWGIPMVQSSSWKGVFRSTLVRQLTDDLLSACGNVPDQLPTFVALLRPFSSNHELLENEPEISLAMLLDRVTRLIEPKTGEFDEMWKPETAHFLNRTSGLVGTCVFDPLTAGQFWAFLSDPGLQAEKLREILGEAVKGERIAKIQARLATVRNNACLVAKCFGSTLFKGSIDWTDAFPVDEYQLELAPMTPHNTDYLNFETDLPTGRAGMTNPLKILHVTDTKFQLGIKDPLNLLQTRWSTPPTSQEKAPLWKILEGEPIGAKRNLGSGQWLPL